jgi:hypothetical protein
MMWLNNTVAIPAGRPKAARLSNSGLLDRRDALYLGLQPMGDRFDLQALARRPHITCSLSLFDVDSNKRLRQRYQSRGTSLSRSSPCQTVQDLRRYLPREPSCESIIRFTMRSLIDDFYRAATARRTPSKENKDSFLSQFWNNFPARTQTITISSRRCQPIAQKLFFGSSHFLFISFTEGRSSCIGHDREVRSWNSELSQKLFLDSKFFSFYYLALLAQEHASRTLCIDQVFEGHDEK